MFTLTEVECLGACVNAPMVQINDNYYVSTGRRGVAREGAVGGARRGHTHAHTHCRPPALPAVGATDVCRLADQSGPLASQTLLLSKPDMRSIIG